MRVLTEVCPACYGEGCRDCANGGTITHGPWHNCQFCSKEICGCGVCQGYCTCRGYWNYYIKSYLAEQDQT